MLFIKNSYGVAYFHYFFVLLESSQSDIENEKKT